MIPLISSAVIACNAHRMELPRWKSRRCAFRASIPAQTADPRRKHRRPHRFRLPAQQKLHRAAADAPLARTHAAARVQLGFAPARAGAHAAQSHIFAAADAAYRRAAGRFSSARRAKARSSAPANRRCRSRAPNSACARRAFCPPRRSPRSRLPPAPSPARRCPWLRPPNRRPRPTVCWYSSTATPVSLMRQPSSAASSRFGTRPKPHAR